MNNNNYISIHSSQYKQDHIRELLSTRLKKLGSIRLKEAFEICREHYSYTVVQAHFNWIMTEMQNNDMAEQLASGLWWIYKNTKPVVTGSDL